MNILNIEHIHKIFGDKVIFDDISCGIDQGEKIGIIGVNGTGKTTLLRVIAGEEEPDEGQDPYQLASSDTGISSAYDHSGLCGRGKMAERLEYRERGTPYAEYSGDYRPEYQYG